MQMEAEVLGFIILGFAAIVLLSLGTIITLWVKTKRAAYAWFLVQVVFLILAFFMFIRLLLGAYNVPRAMLSEENSLSLGAMGLLWALSMVFMLIGIYSLGRTKGNGSQVIGEKQEYNAGLMKVLGMLAFYTLLCPLIPLAVSSIAANIMGFSSEDPLVYFFLTFSSLGLLVLWLKRKYIINSKGMFSMERVGLIYIFPATLTILGLGIVLSQIDNYVRAIFPMSDFWKDAFSKLLGADFATWKGILAIVVAAPIVEEIIFRGLILRSFLKHYSVKKAIILSALLFGVIHLNPWQFVSGLLAGLVLGWWYVKTKSIVLTIYGHALNNSLGFIIGIIGVEIPGFSDSYGSAMNQPLWFNLLGLVLLASGTLWLARLFNRGKINLREKLVIAEERDDNR
jgi:uncharacterized protein